MKRRIVPSIGLSIILVLAPALGACHRNRNPLQPSVTPGLRISGWVTTVEGNEDIRDFQIEVRQREIIGQILVEGERGDGAFPTLLLSFSRVSIPGIATAGYIATPSVTIRPLPDGSFRILLPEGDRQIRSSSAQPRGYAVKSITYGTTDVLNNPMQISKSDASQLRITLTFLTANGP